MTKPARPNFEINLISTHDEGFGYASHQGRVSSKDISLMHVNPNSALFQIQKLLKDDEGDYDCKVVNTESFYDGTYSAKTTVKGNHVFSCTFRLFLVFLFTHLNAAGKCQDV